MLAGGGHTHSLFLKKLQSNPLPECRVILVSATRYTPYSGMLPGVISGNYTPEEAFIDLAQLARESHCEFVEGSVESLDADNQILITTKGEKITYDFLSINTGSVQSAAIDAAHCLPIKPVNRFLSWLKHDLPQRLSHSSSFSLVVLGAGAAGVETVMALQQRFAEHQIVFHLVSGQQVLPGFPASVQTMVLQELNLKGIVCHPNFKVSEIERSSLISTRGERLPYDQLILATTATPSPWPEQSALATDSRGFVLVNKQLCSTSHNNVFAVGDIASFAHASLAKCGVYAVREAPTLYTNIKNRLQQKKLINFRPQRRFLVLLSCADGKAIASRGWFRARGQMVWLWKDYIDRRFMAQFPQPKPGFFNQLRESYIDS